MLFLPLDILSAFSQNVFEVTQRKNDCGTNKGQNLATESWNILTQSAVFGSGSEFT